MSDDDFSDYPRSVAEVRSDKTMRADQWSPRDALIAALRDLDSGKIKPEALIIMWAEKPESFTAVASWYLSSPNPLISQGMVERVRHRLNLSMDD